MARSAQRPVRTRERARTFRTGIDMVVRRYRAVPGTVVKSDDPVVVKVYKD